jgi:hypothetical protein
MSINSDIPFLECSKSLMSLIACVLCLLAAPGLTVVQPADITRMQYTKCRLCITF